MALEVEVKFHVPDLAAFAAQLEAAGATLASPRVFERNVRLDDAAGSLLADSFSLRDDEQLLVKFSYRFEM